MKILLVAAFAAALAAPAFAQPMAPDAVRVTVDYSDLDLNRTAGADAVIRRIEAAALSLCGTAPKPRELRAKARHRACMTAAITGAIRELDAPLVTARFGLPATVVAAR
jgi:UrcA family protein